MTPPISYDHRIRAEIGRLGPLEAFRLLIAENNSSILGPDLDNGRAVAKARSAIYLNLMAHWAEGQHRDSGYSRPFAVVALGGTGREELTPCSDTDFAFLFDDVIEGNAFLAHLQRQAVHTDAFKICCGFPGDALPFNLDDMPTQTGKGLNAFLDMRPIYDPDGLADRFRERIRSTYDPFEHFLHVSKFWRDHWGEPITESERLDHFDIKNDGLRIFLAGIWTLAGRGFCHSHDIYADLEDPRDLKAYGLLLRIRSFVHLRRGTCKRATISGNHPEDILGFGDFRDLGDLLGPDASERERFEFANDIRGRLLSARRRVDRFTWGVIGRVLKQGRPIRVGSAIVYATGGLRDTASDRVSPRDKSRAALAVLLASQRHELPIDPSEMESTFRNAGDWLVPVPELSALFYEPRGSLAKSLGFLSRLPGAGERLFPGFAKFESSLDNRVMAERKLLRGALLRQKIEALEKDLIDGRNLLENSSNPSLLADPSAPFSFAIEAALLDPDHLAAVKLALTTKRLPVTRSDLAARENEALPLHERFSSGFSGIPLNVYFSTCFSDCGFSDKTLKIAHFLIQNRRTLKKRADKDLMDERQVKKIIERSGNDESLLRALLVFTHSDRTGWESEGQVPARWFRIRELFSKARIQFQPDFDSTRKLSVAGFDRDELEILKDFGPDFFNGIYRNYAIRFGSHLLGLKDQAADLPGSATLPPKIERIRIGESEILAVATRDQPGIAASISGAFWKHGVALDQAHLFSATRYGLALDFFHLAPRAPDTPAPGFDLVRSIEEAIVQNLYIGADDEAGLPDVATNVTLEESASGLYRLRAETPDDVGALIYFLACMAFRRLGANIYGLAAHAGRDNAWVSVYLSLPTSLPLEEAQRIVHLWNT